MLSIYFIVVDSDLRNMALRSDVCCNELLCCILGLRALESRLYWILTKEEMEMEDILNKVDRDRTSIQRSLGDLMKAKLITRKKLPTKRGRKYSYKSIDVDNLKKKLMSELNSNYATMKKRILSLDKNVE